MPRWNPPRWPLGVSALVALVVAGCGAAGPEQKPSLHASAEKRLLSLVARARVDTAKQDGTAVHAVLGEFVTEVQTLRTSGQLTATTAGQLDSEARTTAAQAAQRLRPARVENSKPNAADQTTTTPAAPSATSPTTPAAGANPNPASTSPAGNPPPAADSTPQQNDQGNDDPDSPWPRHAHGYGHRLGGGDSGWWTALRNRTTAHSGAGGSGD